MNRREFGRRLALAGAAIFFQRAIPAHATEENAFTAPGAKLEKLPVPFGFAEGPVADRAGDIYFSDWAKKRIYRWSEKNGLSVFMENAPGMVGMDLDPKGNLILASTDKRAILSLDPRDKTETVLADRYNGIRLNSPNDLWCDRKGGVYFSDPRFVQMSEPTEQEVEGVYYLSPDRKRLTRVIGDMQKPNGVCGSLDGKLLYVNDTPADKTWVYRIDPDGTLSGKKLFADMGYDGMTVDRSGNIYITTQKKGVVIFSPSGTELGHIEIPERPTNLCFGGKERKILFITTIPAVYTIRMRVKGI
jgi:gluconolactonase